MKKSVKIRLISSFLAALMLLPLSACGGDRGGNDSDSDETSADEITDGIGDDEIHSSLSTSWLNIESEDKNVSYTPDSLNGYSVPEWYRDAKFGIFIHYGVYSVPAYGDEWYGHWMYMPGTAYGGSNIYEYHKKTYGGASEFGYKDFIPEFLSELGKWSENGMAEEWAELFSAAGAQYVMPVGMHHDSFALYDSDIQTTYSSVAMAGIDYISELQAAVKAKGMKFGISNHFAENDWFFDDASGVGTDVADPAYSELYGTGGEKTESHVRKWYGISMEIIEKYRPDIIYYDFDLSHGSFNTYSDANRYLMLSNYYNLAKTWDGSTGVVCNFKNSAFSQAEAVLNKEREALGEINPTPWQTDTSVGAKSWGYTTNEVYRDGEEFITALIDIVSKNGNLLLNVGPMADGTIPKECQNALLTIGKWLDKYGDAIYATRPWLVYGEGNTQNSGDSYSYNGRDIRFTRSKDMTKLYISALGTPAHGKISVKTLKEGKWDASSIDKICLIDGDSRTPLEWKQTERALEITVPDGLTGACSVEVTFKNGSLIPPIALDSSLTMESDGCFEAENMTLSHSTEDGSNMIYPTADGAYAKYLLSLDGTQTGFLASISGASEGTVEIRKNSADGELLGTLTVEKAKNDAYRQLTAQISPIEGENVICLVFKGKIELSRFKFVSGRSINTVIEAEDYDSKYGTVQAEPCSEGGENLGYVSEGSYVMYANVDFGDGVERLYMRLAASGQSCNIRIDSPNGKVIASSGSVNTGGWTTYQTFEYKLKDVSGVHDVYITFDTDWSSLNVNWFAFASGDYAPEGYVPKESDSAKKTVGEQVGAEYFDAKNGTVQAEACADGGQNLGYVTAGDWVKYADFDFSAGASELYMRLAGFGDTVEVRLDAPNGELIAQFAPSTGAWGTYKTFNASLSSALSGTHDLYIVFVGGASNVNWFKFE